MCRELFKLARQGGLGKRPVPLAAAKGQQWYFFFTAAFWLYLRRAAPRPSHPPRCATRS